MEGKRFLRSIELKNILSYGPEGVRLELEPLNVLIGPNASGKSNLIQALRLLQAAPRDLAKPIREGGGAAEWLFKGGGPSSLPLLEIQITSRDSLVKPGAEISYSLVAAEFSNRLSILEEKVQEDGVVVYQFPTESKEAKSLALLRADDGTERIFSPNLEQSIFSQFRDLDLYPTFTHLLLQFSRISFFGAWSVSLRELRRPQPADLPDDFLLETGHNLGLVLSSLLNRSGYRNRLVEKIRILYPQVEDLSVKVQGGTVQVFLHEIGNATPTPATRLSDGTLHYLCLLAILLHPKPPPLVCIEEPELGLHPDAVSSLGELLIEASSRTQLIVTTHSPSLISALSNIPDAVVVCERDDTGTQLRRLEPEKLGEWLNVYSLGDVWLMGAVGGNR